MKRKIKNAFKLIVFPILLLVLSFVIFPTYIAIKESKGATSSESAGGSGTCGTCGGSSTIPVEPPSCDDCDPATCGGAGSPGCDRVNYAECYSYSQCGDKQTAIKQCGKCIAYETSTGYGANLIESGGPDTSLTCSPVGSTTICADQYGCQGTSTCDTTGYWTVCSGIQEYTVPVCYGPIASCGAYSNYEPNCVSVPGCSWISGVSGSCAGSYQSYAATACSGLSQTSCQQQQGCSWTDTGNRICSGTNSYNCNPTYPACTGNTGCGWTTQSSCQQTQYCSWIGTGQCSGTPNCNYYDSTSCTSHHCIWSPGTKEVDAHCSPNYLYPCSYWSSDPSTCSYVGCSYTTTYSCTGSATGCQYLPSNCVNSLGYVQQGCYVGYFPLWNSAQCNADPHCYYYTHPSQCDECKDSGCYNYDCSSKTDASSCSNIGCAWTPIYACSGTSTPCSSVSGTCTNSLGYAQQGCSVATQTFCGCTASCGSWTNAGCGAGGCTSSQMYQTRTCTNSDCSTSTQTQCVSNSSCTTTTTTSTTTTTTPPGCDNGSPNGYCSSTETQSSCPQDCKITVSMNPNSNLLVGQQVTVNIFFADGRYLANHNVAFNLTINPEGVVWNTANGCQYGGVIMSSNGAGGTTQWTTGTVSNDYNFTTSFTCLIPLGLGLGLHTLYATPTIYSSPSTLHAVAVQFTIAGQSPNADLYSIINSFFSVIKSFLGIK